MNILSNENLDNWCNKRFGKGHMFNKQLLQDFGCDLIEEIIKLVDDLQSKEESFVDDVDFRNPTIKGKPM
jgi:hypothetical protein